MAIRFASLCAKKSKKAPLVIRHRRKYSAVPYIANDTNQYIQLKSGVRVITSQGPETDIASVGVYVYSGSAFEDESNNGVSYLLKSLVPLGNAKTSRAQRASDVERVGANIKVCVGRDLTSFDGVGLKDAVPTLVQVLSDIISPQEFTDSQINTAKSIVAAKKASLSHEAIVKDYVHSAAFQSTSYAQTPYGETASLNSLTSNSVRDFVSKNFTLNRIVVVGSGAINHDEFTQLANTHFSKISTGADIPPYPPVEFTGSEIKIRDDSFHTLYTTIAYQGVGITHPHYWTSLVLAEVFGSFDVNTGSAPYHTYSIAEIFAKEKLAQKYHTFYNPYGPIGLFGFYMETEEAEADDATYELLNCVQKIYANLSPEELQGAKNRAVARVLQNSFGINKTEQLGKFGLFAKKVVHPAEIVARIQAVDKDDVHDFIDKHMYDVDPAVVYHGPTQETPDYNLVRGWTYWNRW